MMCDFSNWLVEENVCCLQISVILSLQKCIFADILVSLVNTAIPTSNIILVNVFYLLVFLLFLVKYLVLKVFLAKISK